MDLGDIILLSIALGMDCLIVSFSQGLLIHSKRRVNSLKLALTMGLFQGLMPIVGYIATHKMYNFLLPYSKWLVFSIFMLLGINFLIQTLKRDMCENINCIDIKCLIGFGIATSIDALISGVSLRLTHTTLWLACLIIGLGSFIMSQIGFWSGNIVKSVCPKVLHILGALILIGLAVKSIL